MSIVSILVWIVLIIVGLGILAMLLFGLRGLSYGKVSPASIGIVSVPLVLLVILGFIMPSWAQAAIVTVVITLGLGVLALLVTGIRSLFT